MSRRNAFYLISSLIFMYIVFVLLTQEARMSFDNRKKNQSQSQEIFRATKSFNKGQRIKDVLNRYNNSSNAEVQKLRFEVEQIINE